MCPAADLWTRPPFWEQRQGGGPISDIMRRYNLCGLRHEMREINQRIEDAQHDLLSANGENCKAHIAVAKQRLAHYVEQRNELMREMADTEDSYA